MRRGSTYLTACFLVLFFVPGVLCSTVAAPGQPLASESDCSKNHAPAYMTGCEHPVYFCAFDPTANLVPRSAPTLARADDLPKNVLALGTGKGLDASTLGAPLLRRDSERTFPLGPTKVSIRLFNSFLDL
jgi:hypothetical protein